MDTQRINRNSRRAVGFTLIEVLLVIVIIGMLATVLVVTIGGQSEGAKVDTTELAIKKLNNELGKFYMNCNRYPTDADGGLKALLTRPTDEKITEKWRGPYLTTEGELNDSWGNPFNYELAEAGASVNGKPYKLTSNGADGQAGTEDDLPKAEKTTN